MMIYNFVNKEKKSLDSFQYYLTTLTLFTLKDKNVTKEEMLPIKPKIEEYLLGQYDFRFNVLTRPNRIPLRRKIGH